MPPSRVLSYCWYVNFTCFPPSRLYMCDEVYWEQTRLAEKQLERIRTTVEFHIEHEAVMSNGPDVLFRKYVRAGLLHVWKGLQRVRLYSKIPSD